MKKNIGIIILSVIIVVIICKLMAPTVITERKINLQNRTSHSNLNRKIEREKAYRNRNLKQEEESEYYEENED